MMDDSRNIHNEETHPVAKPAPEDVMTTQNLVVQAIEGDTGAFGELYISYVEKIYRYVFYNTRSKDVSEDITQEVFLKAWSSIGSCRSKESTFSSWLYRIAHNLMIDRLRKLNRRVSIEIQPMEDRIDTANTAEKNLEQQDLLKCLEILPENQRRIIVLKFIEGLENREIAAIMKKSEGAVRILQMRALHSLKKELDKNL